MGQDLTWTAERQSCKSGQSQIKLTKESVQQSNNTLYGKKK